MLRIEDPFVLHEVFHLLGGDGLLRPLLPIVEFLVTTSVDVPRNFKSSYAGRLTVCINDPQHEDYERHYDSHRSGGDRPILPDARSSYQFHRDVATLLTNVHDQPGNGT